jgi:hypothetical protein
MIKPQFGSTLEVATMNVRVEVVCVNADGGEHRRRVLTIERRELAIETLNRSLTEGKSLLAGVSSDYGCVPTATSGLWKHAREDAFGLINVPNPRWKPTRLPDGWPEDILSDENLAHGQSSPEMLYLETKWASLIPFVRTADLLKEVLPVGESGDGPKSPAANGRRKQNEQAVGIRNR